jgi:hypothetical protein
MDTNLQRKSIYTSREKGFRLELSEVLAPVVLQTQTKGCISTGLSGQDAAESAGL